jgi:TonB-dependent SusC/RagA subfamily outer membrane receptor
MKASCSAGPNAYRPWLLSTLALLFVTGCATGPSPAGGPSDNVDIGYGAVDKDQVTGSVSTVQGEDDEMDRPRTLVEMLSRVPGVRVIERAYGETSVRIRGGSSFLADEDPLFVVDGVMMPSGASVFRNINANQIESISVLKDAGQTAVYGSRGANGVVLITMKKGSG